MTEAQRPDGTIVHITRVRPGDELGWTCIGTTPIGPCTAAMRACALTSDLRTSYFRSLGSHDEGCDLGARAPRARAGVEDDAVQPVRPPGGHRLIMTLEPILRPDPAPGVARRIDGDPALRARHQVPDGPAAVRANIVTPEGFLRALIDGRVGADSQIPMSPSRHDLVPAQEALVHANSLEAMFLGSSWVWGTLDGPPLRDRYDQRDGWALQAPLPGLVLSVKDSVKENLDRTHILRDQNLKRAHFLVYASPYDTMSSWHGAPAIVIGDSRDVRALIRA